VSAGGDLAVGVAILTVLVEGLCTGGISCGRLEFARLAGRVVGRGIVSDVKAGENGGRQLHHDFAVVNLLQSASPRATASAKENLFSTRRDSLPEKLRR